MTISLFHRGYEDDRDLTGLVAQQLPRTAPTGAVLESARKFLIVTTACATMSTFGVVSQADATDLVRQQPTARTVPVGSAIPKSNTPPALLLRIRRRAELTWGEVAHALGVTRRTVHLWLTGAKIAAVHQSALESLDRLVQETPGHNVEERRARLVELGPSGRSLLDDLALASRQTRRVSLSSVSVAAQLGPVTDLTAGDVVAPARKSSLRGKAVPKRKPSVE
jgi:DNA-binding transcriptional regulator YiaG